MEPDRYPKHIVEQVMNRRERFHAFDRFDPATTALLVVDMQVSFLQPGSLFEIPTARRVVPTINRLARALRQASGRVVWVISTYGPRSEDRWSTMFDYIMGPEVGQAFREGLSEGTEGHAIWPELEVEASEPIVAKNRIGGFIGSQGRLDKMLRELGIDTVLIAGTVTTVCCETTAREAAMHDYKTVMISDANGGRTEEEDLHTYSIFIRTLGDVMSADEVLARLRLG
jgi:ureidoacrylate peracid hydrolase